MNRALRVVIPEETATKLAALARREFRATRQQASVLLVEAVERATPAGATRRARGDQA